MRFGVEIKEKLDRRFKELRANASIFRDDATPKALLRIYSEVVKGVQHSPGATPAVRYGPYNEKKVKGDGRAVKRRNVLVSKPHEPFQTDTGEGVANIAWQYDRSTGEGAVGTNLKRLVYLELGTKTIVERPWLSKAVAKVRSQVPFDFKYFAKDLWK